MSMTDILADILPDPPAIRIHVVTLGVRDVAAATAFYERLGLVRSSASNDNVTFFQVGGVVLGLFGRTALAADATVPAGEGGFSGVTLAWSLVSEAAVDDAFRRMVEAGATGVKSPQPAFWGGYSGYAADPDGHLWELIYEPNFPLNASGEMVLP